ncbi:porin family protein [Parapedobacter koreensis]|uniref:Outer membrane protein beta-barrel domain-containing protein n=1 Tax=Parapedobacter koreensis TaxID=332977 RepID=A0A1H7EWT0_9SPHI|nr:hypothetical protein [Parapedobacter koreensis]SEK18343.1 hypothetical protein SAMN05421740_10189 [Parapedobacter koreensis]
MQDKHPIDKLFKDGLADPHIPFEKKEWRALSKKLHVRKERKIPLWIWVGSGAVAAVILVAMLLVMDRQTPTEDAAEYAREIPRTAPSAAAGDDSTTTPNNKQHGVPAIAAEGRSGKPTPRLVNATQHVSLTPPERNQTPALPRPNTALPYALYTRPIAPHLTPYTDSLHGISFAHVASPNATLRQDRDALTSVRERSWTFSILAAPDFSGTQPLGGKLSGNAGLMVTYRLNHWLTASTGALYAKKRYETDFANYRPGLRWSGGTGSPSLVIADCGVLDIPLNIGVDISRAEQSSWFVSAGISSYLMLRETYDYIYPPHEYGYPKQITLYNQNRHILGIGNLSVGYRRKLMPSLALTVQPFVKVPLTGIGNGNLKLYSSGIAISADIDLTRRRKP